MPAAAPPGAFESPVEEIRGREVGVRPLVALPRPGLSAGMVGGGIVLAALLLFSVLESRRRALTTQSVPVRAVDAVTTPAPPPLYIPPDLDQARPVLMVAAPPQPLPAPRPPPPPQPRIIYLPQPALPPIQLPAEAPRLARSANEPALVVDTTSAEGAALATADEASAASAAVAPMGRARANVMRHRSTTVPQGTLIPAVLETALDSTRPGLARAQVSRDVRGFDGNRVLIPRGSRLIGEYRADLAPGQNRALVTWTRLTRPDGVIIAIGSPAADTLGRVGIRGKVNSHFFARFSAAILQSTLEVGVNLASQLGRSPVFFGLPGALQSGVSPIGSGGQIAPTLRVNQGVAITVFVARDLDFTSVETRR